jgi:hypothetical protein
MEILLILIGSYPLGFVLGFIFGPGFLERFFCEKNYKEAHHIGLCFLGVGVIYTIFYINLP